jgi:hypothetical protein
LRWRLRFKADPDVDAAAINPLITAYATQLGEACDVVLGQV